MYGGKRDSPGDWQNRSRPGKREWDDDNGRSDLKRRRPFEEGRPPRDYGQYRPPPPWNRGSYAYDRAPPRGGYNRDRGRFRDRPDYADSPRSYSGGEAGELSDGEVPPSGQRSADGLPPPPPLAPGYLPPRMEDGPGPATATSNTALPAPPPPPPHIAAAAAAPASVPTEAAPAPTEALTSTRPDDAIVTPATAAASENAAAAATPAAPEIQTARTKAARTAIDSATAALDLQLPAAAGKEILLLDIERLDTAITDLEDAIAATRAAIVTAHSVANMPKARNLVQRLYDVNRAIAAQVHAQHPMEPAAAAAAAARILDPAQLPSVREAINKHAAQRGRVMELLAARARAQHEHDREVVEAYKRNWGSWHLRERRREEAAAAAEAAKLRSPSVAQADSLRRSLRVQQQGEVELQAEIRLAERESLSARETYQRQVAPEQPMLPAPERARRFIDHNGRMWNPVAAETEFNLQTPWTRDEVREFMQKFMVAPKNFRRIATALDTKTVGDVVAFYYRHKHQLRIKDVMRAQLKKRGRARERMDEGGGTRTSRLTLLSRSASSAVAAAVAAAPVGDAFVAPGVAFAGAGIKRDRDEEAVSWTTEEQERFFMGISRFGRDYAAVAHVVVSKSAAQCKAFDYALRKRLRGDVGGEDETAAAAASTATAQAGAGAEYSAGFVSGPGTEAGAASSLAQIAAGGDAAESGSGKNRRPRGLASWTPDERDEFLAAFKDYGRSWRMLQERLPGKTLNQIKHYYQVMREQLQLDTIVPLHSRRPGGAPQRGRPPSSAAAAAAAAATISTIAAVALAVAQADGTVAAASGPQIGGIAGSLAEPVVRLRRESSGSDSENISVMSDSEGEETETVAASTATSTPVTPAAVLSTPPVPVAVLPTAPPAQSDAFSALSILARTAEQQQQQASTSAVEPSSTESAAERVSVAEAAPVEMMAMDAAPVQSEPTDVQTEAARSPVVAEVEKPVSAESAASDTTETVTTATAAAPPAAGQHPIVHAVDDMETEEAPAAPLPVATQPSLPQSVVSHSPPAAEDVGAAAATTTEPASEPVTAPTVEAAELQEEPHASPHQQQESDVAAPAEEPIPELQQQPAATESTSAAAAAPEDEVTIPRSPSPAPAEAADTDADRMETDATDAVQPAPEAEPVPAVAPEPTIDIAPTAAKEEQRAADAVEATASSAADNEAVVDTSAALPDTAAAPSVGDVLSDAPAVSDRVAADATVTPMEAGETEAASEHPVMSDNVVATPIDQLAAATEGDDVAHTEQPTHAEHAAVTEQVAESTVTDKTDEATAMDMS